MKILGKNIDCKLTWKTRINKRVGNSNIAFDILKVINSSKVDDPQIALQYYKPYIITRVDYFSVLYEDASEILLKKLEVLRDKNLKLCISYLHSTTVNFVL